MLRASGAAVFAHRQHSSAGGQKKGKTAEIAGSAGMHGYSSPNASAKRLRRRVLEWRGSADTHTKQPNGGAPAFLALSTGGTNSRRKSSVCRVRMVIAEEGENKIAEKESSRFKYLVSFGRQRGRRRVPVT